jgi:hypothetical protein
MDLEDRTQSSSGQGQRSASFSPEKNDIICFFRVLLARASEIEIASHLHYLAILEIYLFPQIENRIAVLHLSNINVGKTS